MRAIRSVRLPIIGAAALAVAAGPAAPAGAASASVHTAAGTQGTAATASRAPRYHTTDLGTLGGAESIARAINNRGAVVGLADLPDGRSHAFLWQRGKMTDLGTLGGDNSAAWAINDRGEVAGWTSTRSQGTRAFLWRRGKTIDLGTLGGTESMAYDINDRGQVIGLSTTRTDDWHAFRWERGRMTDLGGFHPLATNDLGQVVGTDEHAGLRATGTAGHAVLWWHGVMRHLGSGTSRATAINEISSIIVQTDAGRTYLWRYGKMTRLPTLGGPTTSPTGLNDLDQIVGQSDVNGPPMQTQHAFLWQRGTMTDLTKQGLAKRAFIKAINDRGQIAGDVIGEDAHRAALFSPW